MNRPNIVYILADDMGYGDLGCFGATKIPTPHMDRIAREGIRFTDAHAASAVCTPSRYAVMTGRYCWRSPIQQWVLGGFGAPIIEPQRTTVASFLQAQGYATAAVGKWHLGFDWTRKDGRTELVTDFGNPAWSVNGFDLEYDQPLRGGPVDLGFDSYYGIAGSLDMPPYCFIENDRVVGTPDREKEHYYHQQRQGLQVADWRDEAVDVTFAAKSVEFIETHVAHTPEQPFFLYLAAASPHRPCDVRPDFVIGQSDAGDRGDMVVLFDWMVGQVLDALDRSGVAGETLVIVTSDNGARLTCADGKTYGHKANGDWRGQKADIWDGGHREPLVARWPGRIAAASSSDALVCLSDLLATCADLCAAALPDGAGEDSVSMLPLFEGRADAHARQEVIHHSSHGMFSIRQGAWKLVDGLGSGGFTDPVHETPQRGGAQGQLYNLTTDPAERLNRWLDDPEIVERLSARLREIRRV